MQRHLRSRRCYLSEVPEEGGEVDRAALDSVLFRACPPAEFDGLAHHRDGFVVTVMTAGSSSKSTAYSLPYSSNCCVGLPSSPSSHRQPVAGSAGKVPKARAASRDSPAGRTATLETSRSWLRSVPPSQAAAATRAARTRTTRRMSKTCSSGRLCSKRTARDESAGSRRSVSAGNGTYLRKTPVRIRDSAAPASRQRRRSRQAARVGRG